MALTQETVLTAHVSSGTTAAGVGETTQKWSARPHNKLDSLIRGSFHTNPPLTPPLYDPIAYTYYTTIYSCGYTSLLLTILLFNY